MQVITAVMGVLLPAWRLSDCCYLCWAYYGKRFGAGSNRVWHPSVLIKISLK